MTTQRLLIGDTETSSLDDNAKVVEIAWLEVDADLNVIDEQRSLIDPEVPISPGASGVHHITNDAVKDSPTIEQFFYDVLGGKLKGDIVLAAHNVAFDLKFFSPWCESIVDTLCTLRLARRFFPNTESHRLQVLRYELGLNAGEAHSALGDVKAVRSLLQRISSVSGKSVDELRKACKEPIYIHAMPFGKHKGTFMHDVPVSYLQWLSKQGDLDPDLSYTITKTISLKAG